MAVAPVTAINPYAGFGKVVCGSRLVGRERAITEITDKLYSNAGSMAIIGNPRIGKTSIVTEAVSRLRSISDKHITIEIALSTLATEAELFTELANYVKTRLQETGPIANSELLLSPSDYEAYKLARASLHRANKQGYKTVIVLDEFDSITAFPSGHITIQRLRELMSRNHETGLSAVIVARRSLRAIEAKTRNMSDRDISTLDGVCEQMYLRPLDRKGLTELADRAEEANWLIAPQDCEQLWFYTGGHPFLAEMILCSAYHANSVSDGASESIAGIFDYYEHLRELLEEDSLFEQMIQVAVGPRMSLRPGSLERLVRYGLVTKADDSPYYSGWSDHFQAYLERAARDTPLVELWKQTEMAVRQFVQDIYRDAIGENWREALSRKYDHIARILVDCEKRMEREKANFTGVAALDLLDYSYPMDLWAFITAEWNFFRDKLGGDKTYWNTRFSYLAKVRTPTAHSRDILSPKEAKQAEIYCGDILDALGRV